MKITDLTPTEEDIMKCVWNINSGYLRDIIAALPQPKPHQNTVSTYIKILAEKEFISTRKEGRIFFYKVIIPFEHYQNYKLNQFLEIYFQSKPLDLVQRLLALNLISSEDLSKNFNTGTTSLTQLKKSKKKKSPLRDFINELTTKKNKKKKKKKKK